MHSIAQEPPISIPQVAEAIQHLLTEVARQAGHDSRFVQRQGGHTKLDGALFVQTLVFGWLAKPRGSLHELCQTAAALGVRLSPQALDQRFTPQAAACLEAVLRGAVQTVVQAAPVACAVLERFPAVWLEDSTVIDLPEFLAPLWPGCGGGNGGGQAALKWHVRYELRSGQIQGPLAQAGRCADRSTPLAAQPLAPGSLYIADLGFFNLKQWLAWQVQEVFFLSRVQAGTLVWWCDETDRRGQASQGKPPGQWRALPELLTLLARRQPTDKRSHFEARVLVGKEAQVACRLLVLRVPPRLAAQRRAALHREAKRKGQAVSQERLALAGWTVLASNVPSAQLSVSEAWELYRARWQIERLFRLWKEVGAVDEWRSDKPWRILCEVYAKLLACLIEHWIVLSSGWQEVERSLQQMVQSMQKQAWSLARALGSKGRLVRAIRELAFCFACGCRLNKRRAKPSTVQRLQAASPP